MRTQLNQPELQHHVEILVNNGKLPETQVTLAEVGLDPAVFDEGASILEMWQQSRRQAKAVLADQKRATRAEKTARRAAQQKMTDLKRTARVLFADDEPVLTSLGLHRPRHRRNGTGDATETAANGNGHKANGYQSQSTAAVLDRWRILVGNAQTLEQPQLDSLALAGWGSEQLVAAADLVEAFAAAAVAQQDRIKDYRAEMAKARQLEQQVRQWRRRVVGLIKVAMKRLDSDHEAQLRSVLGL